MAISYVEEKWGFHEIQLLNLIDLRTANSRDKCPFRVWPIITSISHESLMLECYNSYLEIFAHSFVYYGSTIKPQIHGWPNRVLLIGPKFSVGSLHC
jgi:hypothetical protein